MSSRISSEYRDDLGFVHRDYMIILEVIDNRIEKNIGDIKSLSRLRPTKQDMERLRMNLKSMRISILNIRDRIDEFRESGALTTEEYLEYKDILNRTRKAVLRQKRIVDSIPLRMFLEHTKHTR